MTADGQLDAAVLRHPPLGNVQVGHHLDAGRDGKGQVARRRHHFIEHAVGLDANAEFVLEWLEVQVAGVIANRNQQHHVQQLADRRAIGQGLDAGQIDRAVPLGGLGGGGQLRVGVHVLYEAFDAFATGRVIAIQRLENVALVDTTDRIS